jgi:hypothetical protein
METETSYVSIIQETIEKMERDYISGNTTLSKYVSESMSETINTIEAYIHSKHISGLLDSLDREKPFFNIITASINIWFRATDIDRKDIKISPSKESDVISSLLATVVISDWMKKERFGEFLNEWGRTLARFGSAIVKFVPKKDKLHIIVVPWTKSIVDSVDFENNPKIELLELTPSQLRKNPNYDQDIVESLIKASLTTRETNDKVKKDSKTGYIKLYEITGEFPLAEITGNEKDADTYVQQMHTVSFVQNSTNKNLNDKFTLFKGRLDYDPYFLTHLIKEEGQTLAIGAVQHLFDAQWMMNHSIKAMKDQLDLASKLIFQTADGNFVGQNALSSIETGDILIHSTNFPITKVDNSSHDIAQFQNFSNQWKVLSNEINGISEAMLGQNPPSGSAWRQTEALLNESHSLFELMTENKGLQLEQMFREYIIPYIKKHYLNHSKEIASILDSQTIKKIDAKYISNKANKVVNKKIKEMLLNGQTPTPEMQGQMTTMTQGAIQTNLQDLGNTRFFKPSEISDKTWGEILKDLEWNLDINITGEAKDISQMMTTLNTALTMVARNPNILQDPNMKIIFNRIIELTGVISPTELVDTPAPIASPMTGQVEANKLPAPTNQ